MSLLDDDLGAGGPPPITIAPPQFAQISTGGGPGAPAPMGAPPPVAPVSQPQTPSLWQRIQQAAQHLSSNINPTPQPLLDSGLITEDDLKHARSRGLLDFGLGILGSPTMGTFGQALAGGVNNMRQGFNDAIQEPVKTGMEAQQIAYQQGILRARSQIGQYYAPQPGDSPQTIVAKKLALSQHLQSIGDLEGAKAAGAGLDGAYGNLTQPLKVTWELNGQYKIPKDQFGNTIPWLSPLKMTGAPMGPEQLELRREGLDVIKGNAASNREDRLVQQYDADTKGYKTAADQIDQAYSALPAAKQHNAAAQQSLLYNVMNLEHPGETVPRNQVTQYAQSLGPAEQIHLFGSRLEKGQAALTDSQVAQLESVLREAHGRLTSAMGPVMSTYGKRAKAQGVDPSVFIDPTELLNQKWGAPNVVTSAPPAAANGAATYSSRNPYAAGQP